jgi:hypothetical protein
MGWRGGIRWFLAGLAGTTGLMGQDVDAMVGRLHGMAGGGATYAWQLQVTHNFTRNLGLGFAWLNEGHLDDHHRDGLVVQGWYQRRVPSNRLRLGVGLGVLRSFDTARTGDDEGEDYRNDHHLQPILSLKAHYPWRNGSWGTTVQINRVFGNSGHATQAILVGAGARFGRRASDPPPEPAASEGRQELALLVGRTILNSFSSETTRFMDSLALEYRYRASRHVALSVAYTDEGDLDEAKRDGLSALVWLTTPADRSPWRLSLGLGPYVSRVFPSDHTGPVTVRTSGRYALALDRALGGHWGVRFLWNRTLTRNNRDTDALLSGLTYAW